MLVFCYSLTGCSMFMVLMNVNCGDQDRTVFSHRHPSLCSAVTDHTFDKQSLVFMRSMGTVFLKTGTHGTEQLDSLRMHVQIFRCTETSG